MKIGVTSDTHSLKIPQQLIDEFKKADLIIHAGDFCTENDVAKFHKLGTLKAVHGNMDEPGVRLKFPESQIITCEDKKIGLYHGRGSRSEIIKTVMGEFKGLKVDIVIFGHSHIPFNEIIDGTLYFNPGSPNDTVTSEHCTYGRIDIVKGKILAKIVKVK